LASSLAKFRRALAGEMLGYMDGYRPISAQRRIFFASRCSRICGRACNSIFLRQNSGSALLVPELGSQFLQQKWKFRVSDQMTNPAEPAKMLLHEEDLKVRE